MSFKNILFLFIPLTLICCTVSETEKVEVKEQVTLNPIDDADSTAAREADIMVTAPQNAIAMRDEINDYRETIENSLIDFEKGRVNLNAARKALSKDWHEMNFHKNEEKVVRIQTFPQLGDTSRTEEYYFINDELVFAVIGKESSTTEAAADSFYYENGEIIVEQDYDASSASVSEKEILRLGTRIQNQAKDYLEFIYRIESDE
jgi:hypothetical protein